jgi:hypothetical protein
MNEDEKKKTEEYKSLNNFIKNNISKSQNEIKKDHKTIINFRNIFNFQFEKVGGYYLISEDCVDKIITEITNSYDNKTIFNLQEFDFELEDKINNVVSAVIIKFSIDWYISKHKSGEIIDKERLKQKTKDEVEKTIKRYLRIKNLYIGDLWSDCSSSSGDK